MTLIDVLDCAAAMSRMIDGATFAVCGTHDRVASPISQCSPDESPVSLPGLFHGVSVAGFYM
jgi:hypothetical protein